MQAKDIADELMLLAVLTAQEQDRVRLAEEMPYYVKEGDSLPWAMGWDVDALLPGIPYKVTQAKRAKLIKRGLMDGCTCGCRGDFELTPAGLAFLAA